jgi:hypothetical protein
MTGEGFGFLKGCLGGKPQAAFFHKTPDRTGFFKKSLSLHGL